MTFSRLRSRKDIGDMIAYITGSRELAGAGHSNRITTRPEVFVAMFAGLGEGEAERHGTWE